MRDNKHQMTIMETRRELCNEIIRGLNTCDRYISETITHCETGNVYPKNEVFVVDDIYELIERFFYDRKELD